MIVDDHPSFRASARAILEADGFEVETVGEGEDPQARRGIWNLENVDSKSLVDKKVLEDAFIWAPLRIIGATGSPGKPMVLY